MSGVGLIVSRLENNGRTASLPPGEPAYPPGLPGHHFLSGSPHQTEERLSSTPVATRNATSTSLPPDLSSPPAGNVPAGVKPFPNVSCTLQQENIRILKVVDDQVEEPCSFSPIYELVIKGQRERQHLAHCNLSLQCNWNRAYAAHAKNGYLRVVGNRSPMDATYGSVVGDGEHSTVELLQPQSALLRPLD